MTVYAKFGGRFLMYFFFSRIYCCHKNVCKVSSLNSPLLAGKIFDIYTFFFQEFTVAMTLYAKFQL